MSRELTSTRERPSRWQPPAFRRPRSVTASRGTRCTGSRRTASPPDRPTPTWWPSDSERRRRPSGATVDEQAARTVAVGKTARPTQESQRAMPVARPGPELVGVAGEAAVGHVDDDLVDPELAHETQQI